MQCIQFLQNITQSIVFNIEKGVITTVEEQTTVFVKHNYQVKAECRTLNNVVIVNLPTQMGNVNEIEIIKN